MTSSLKKPKTYEVGSIHQGNIHREYEEEDGALEKILKFYKSPSVERDVKPENESDFDSIENWLEED